MSDHIPPELFPDILSRLSVEPLLRFRCVCKSWLRLIDDPAFLKLHLHRQSEAGGNMFLTSNRSTNDKLYTLSTNSLYNYSLYNYSQTPTNTLEASPLRKWTVKDFQVPNIKLSSHPIFSSCNGLILVDLSGEDKLIIWNPFITGETFLLPRDTCEEFNRTIFIGLGFDFGSDDYKVVKLKVHRNDHRFCWKTWVFSLKLNSWKIIMDSPSLFIPDNPGDLYPANWRSPGVFFNGRLHWITRATEVAKGVVILAFDLATEEYHLLPLPDSVILSSSTSIVMKESIDVFGECLFLTCPSDSIYRLDDYGGKTEWTKLFSFGNIVTSYIRPIAYLKTKGELLFIVSYIGKVHYFWVNIYKGYAKKVTLEDDEFSIGYNLPLSCNGSLVRLSKYTGTDITVATKETTMKTNGSNDRLQVMMTTTNVENDTNNVWSAMQLMMTTTNVENDTNNVWSAIRNLLL